MSKSIALIAFGLAVVCAQTAHADAAACKPVIDALGKMAQTPYHEWAVEYGKNSKTIEKIALADTLYVFMDGKWRQVPYDQTSAAAEVVDSMKGATCWVMREESVDGEKATLYGVHTTNAAGNTLDTQIWVSKMRALPIKELLTQPKDGQAHAMNIRLDYTNVRPPM
jgi:hypothetical protein